MERAETIIQHNIEPPVNSWLLSLLVGLLLLVVVFIMGWTLRQNEQATLERLIRTEADNMASYISGDLRSRIPALQRIVRRWETAKTSQKQFEDDAGAYVTDIPGFQALEWVDPTYHVRWIVPMSGNEKALDLDLSSEPRRRLALEKARMKKDPSMTKPVDLVQGGKGLLAYFPIYRKGEFDGFVLAVFNIREWLDYVFSIREREDEQLEYRVAVSIGDETVYKQKRWDDYANSPLQSKQSLSVLGHTFIVHVVPTEIFTKHHSSPLPLTATISGITLSLLVAILVYMYQSSSLAIWRSDLVKGALEDEIIERVNTQKTLQDITTRLGLATKAGGIGVWTWDVKDNKLHWDNRMFELYDIPPDVKVVYESWRNAVHPDDVEDAEGLIMRAVEGKAVFDTEFRIIDSAGEIRHIKAAARVERDETGDPQRMTGVNWDVTSQKKAEEQITHMANHDALTGLPSLRLARDRITLALGLADRKKALAAIMFVDLDGFKLVNDEYGHDAGDALLKDVARRLQSSVREVDTVARIGGDEFLVVINELNDRTGAEVIAKSLIKAVSETFYWQTRKLTVGASVGISLYPDHGQTPDALIKQADQAMYVIKTSGKNGFAFADLENDLPES